MRECRIKKLCFVLLFCGLVGSICFCGCRQNITPGKTLIATDTTEIPTQTSAATNALATEKAPTTEENAPAPISPIRCFDEVRETKTAAYQITSKNVAVESDNQVSIYYPQVEIAEDLEFSEQLNQLLYDRLLLGQSESDYTQAEGVTIVDNDYTITYAEEDCFSIAYFFNCFVLNGSRSFSKWGGMTVDVKNKKILTLADLEFSPEKILAAMQTGTAEYESLPGFENSPELQAAVKRAYIQGDAKADFFLTSDAVYFLAPKVAAITQENGWIRVPR